MDTERDAKMDWPPLVDLGRVLGFFASVIKSGEPWTGTCQREYDAANRALKALYAVSAPPAPIAGMELVEPVAFMYRERAFPDRWSVEIGTADAEKWRSGGWETVALVPASALTAANADRDRLERERDEMRAALDADPGNPWRFWRDKAAEMAAKKADRDRLEKERDALRVALCRYGDPYRMSNAPPELQQFIDAAFATRSPTP